MSRIAVTPTAFEAVLATMPPRSVEYEAQLNEKGARPVRIERLRTAQAAA